MRRAFRGTSLALASVYEAPKQLKADHDRHQKNMTDFISKDSIVSIA